MATRTDSLNIKTNSCRACNRAIYPRPLLTYQNMPATAQGFPTLETLAQDHGSDLEVCQCSACGLIQLNTKPVAYYKDVIRAAAFSPEMGEFRLAQLKKWAEKYQLGNRKVLEVGCGHGEYLSLLNTAGMDAYGVEHADNAVKDCQSQGLKVWKGYMGEDAEQLNHALFDGFVCLNFMEHWPDPSASLLDIANHLNDGAIGLIEVPNFDMVLNKGLFSEFISDHLMYFTESTLKTMLQSNGFEVIECKPVWHDYILSAVVQKRRVTNLSFFEQYKTEITTQLNQYINQFSENKVAIWGAGHQSLSVIALANLAHKISYVIDSAPFKQGKYTPATHLPIVSADQLTIDPVEAIIVMAASYSDEVARMIRSQYAGNIRVAILRDDGLEEV